MRYNNINICFWSILSGCMLPVLTRKVIKRQNLISYLSRTELHINLKYSSQHHFHQAFKKYLHFNMKIINIQIFKAFMSYHYHPSYNLNTTFQYRNFLDSWVLLLINIVLSINRNCHVVSLGTCFAGNNSLYSSYLKSFLWTKQFALNSY